MKKMFRFSVCCLMLFSSLITARAQEEEKEIRICSPLIGIGLTVTDTDDGEEITLTAEEGGNILPVPLGHTIKIEPAQPQPGWISSREMIWKIGDETDTVELPIHPFKAAFELRQTGPEDEPGSFQFALYEGKKELATWQSAAGETYVSEDLPLTPGSRLILRMLSAPDGYIQNTDREITVPQFLENDTWLTVSDAVPYEEKTVSVLPEAEGLRLSFYAEKDDDEVCLDAEGNPAEYKTDQDGTFTAVLGQGKYYVTCRETEKGVYPLDKEEFFFDLHEEHLKIERKPIRIYVRAYCDTADVPEGIVFVLFAGEEEICRIENEGEKVRLPAEVLEAGCTYLMKALLPEGYECEESIQFTVSGNAPEEDPVISFEIMQAQEETDPSPQILPPAPEIIPAKETVTEKKSEQKEEQKETLPEKKKENIQKEEPVPSRQVFEIAANDPPAKEEIRQRSFLVVLKDMKGNILKGAVLRVEDEQGETVAQWISEDGPHRIRDGVVPGESYIISQQTAVPGYEKMQMKIRFTMPKEGNDEPLVTLQNRESETMKIEDEPAVHVPYLLYGGAASAAVFAAGVTWLLLRRQKKQEQ